MNATRPSVKSHLPGTATYKKPIILKKKRVSASQFLRELRRKDITITDVNYKVPTIGSKSLGYFMIKYGW